MKYESTILKRLIDTYGVVGNPRYISEIIKEFIVRGKERFPELFTYQADWLAHIDEFGLNPSYTVRYTGQSIYAPNTLERPVKSAILSGMTLVNYFKPLDDVNASGSICGFQDGKIAFQFGDEGSIWGNSYTSGNISLTNSIKVSPNTKYFVKLILSKPIDGAVQFGNFKESEYSTSDVITLANNNTIIYQATMTTGTDTDYIGVILNHSVGEIVYGELLVIPYQDGMENWNIPYFDGIQSVKMPVLTTSNEDGTKTNILSTSEDVELRAVGDVRDELDLLTGKVTERIGEVVLDGSENWMTNKETETHASYYLSIESNMKPLFKAMTNSLTSYEWGDVEELTKECFWSFTSSYGIIVSKAECPTIEDFKQKLSNNPVLLQYELNESTVKTVDLTILDQNGQSVDHLKSFNGGTHVYTSSLEGSLVPSVDISVVTNLEETLKICSLEGNTM